MNVRIFWVCAMKCMCAQTRPRFILSSKRVFLGMEFEPMLTPREKSPLLENFPRGGSNPWHCGQRAQTLPTSYSGPWFFYKSFHSFFLKNLLFRSWWIFTAEWIFPLEWTWFLTPFPKNLLDKSINQGLVCAHMHSVAWTQKITHVLYGWMPATKTHPVCTIHVTTSMVGLKKIPYAKISQKMVKPRDIAGSTEEEEFYTIKASDSKTQQRVTLRYTVLVLTNQHNSNHLAPILSPFHTLEWYILPAGGSAMSHRNNWTSL